MMGRIIFFLLFLNFNTYSQYTYVPDNNFEQSLINLGVDSILDDYVYTSSIDTVTVLYIFNNNIADLTGIEDFISLRELFCYSNDISFLDLSNNTQLFEVSCGSNKLNYINMKNGNNQGLWYFNSMNNPNLSCVDVDDVLWAEYNWSRDNWTIFKNNCSVTGIKEKNEEKKLIKVLDSFGRKAHPAHNKSLIYVYSDGSVERKFLLKE